MKKLSLVLMLMMGFVENTVHAKTVLFEAGEYSDLYVVSVADQCKRPSDLANFTYRYWTCRVPKGFLGKLYYLSARPYYSDQGSVDFGGSQTECEKSRVAKIKEMDFDQEGSVIDPCFVAPAQPEEMMPNPVPEIGF